MSKPGLGEVLSTNRILALEELRRDRSWSLDRSKKLVQRLDRQLEAAESRPPRSIDFDQIRREIRDLWSARAALEDLSPRHLRLFPWVAFGPPDAPASAWLAADDGLTRAYLGWLHASRRRSAISAAIRVLLDTYPTELPTFHAWRQGLRDLGERPGVLLPESAPAIWVRHRLLSQDVALSLAALLTQELSDSASSVLTKLRLVPELERSGFMREVCTRVGAQAESELTTSNLSPDSLQRVLELFATGSSLRFEMLRPTIAGHLLRPFRTRAAAGPIQQKIQSFILAHLGDPRLGSAKWAGVAESERDTLKRWLAQQSFELFFEVLDRTAQENHWRSRRAFWKEYLDAGVMTDVWLVLGRDAQELVSTRVSSASNATFRSNVDRAQSALLLRLRGRTGATLTIAEFSHQGSCRVWREPSARAPKLYQTEYSLTVLRAEADHRQPHHGNAQGTWQNELRTWLRRYCAVDPLRV
ncbi:MAG: hypothetical protein JST54_12860 [Deltaproteobacteria bacterium]|nr:hypothetical protein [Deltaproteobacteria bacterium]